MFIFGSKLVQSQLNFIRRMDEKEYSKKLNNKLVRYSNDSKLSDQRMVRFYLRNTGLITEISKSVLRFSKGICKHWSSIQKVQPIKQVFYRLNSLNLLFR